MFKKLSVFMILALSTGISAAQEATVSIVAQGLGSPWAMEFLPNGEIIVTERDGKLRVIKGGNILDAAIDGTPEIYLAGQGGLLDVMLDTNFTNNQKLYLSYAYGDSSGNATRLMSAMLDGYTLTEQTVLFTASPLKKTGHHYGGRIAQMDDGSLLLTVGDGFDHREQAQTLDNHFGKIIRINQDGTPHKDNPFISTDGAKPEIWSYGHRNPQALLVANGVVYENEHGPQGGDEVNVIRPGVNYGWPITSYGIDYNGAQITPFKEYPGMEQPKINWTPSIAPSSMVHYRGDLYVTSLAEQSIRRLTVVGDTVSDTGKVFPQLNERMRDIVTGKDGHLYVLTDGDNAKLLKLEVN